MSVQIECIGCNSTGKIISCITYVHNRCMHVSEIDMHIKPGWCVQNSKETQCIQVIVTYICPK